MEFQCNDFSPASPAQFWIKWRAQHCPHPQEQQEARLILLIDQQPSNIATQLEFGCLVLGFAFTPAVREEAAAKCADLVKRYRLLPMDVLKLAQLVVVEQSKNDRNSHVGLCDPECLGGERTITDVDTVDIVCAFETFQRRKQYAFLQVSLRLCAGNLFSLNYPEHFREHCKRERKRQELRRKHQKRSEKRRRKSQSDDNDDDDVKHDEEEARRRRR